jgi:hypothetical protein
MTPSTWDWRRPILVALAGGASAAALVMLAWAWAPAPAVVVATAPMVPPATGHADAVPARGESTAAAAAVPSLDLLRPGETRAVHPELRPAPGRDAATSPTGPVLFLVGDGCAHGYGEVNQCVPVQFPPGVTDRCAWLRAHDFGPLAVHGEDRLGLDLNRDGIACGPGDG